MSKGNIYSNFMWRLLERFGAQGVTFVVSIILARLLAPEVYGTVALVTIFMTILQVFVDSGLGNALIQKKNADDLDFSSVFYFNISVCIFLYFALFLCARPIADFYKNQDLVLLIRVMGLNIIISGVRNIQQAYVSRKMLFKKFFFSTLGGTLGASVVGITMAYRGYGAWSIVAQMLFCSIIDTLVLWFTVKWRPKLMFSWNRLIGLLSYGWKLLVSSLLDVGYNKLREMIIGRIYTTKDLAYYNKGDQLPSNLVINICTAIDSVLLPTMAAKQDDLVSVKAMTRKAIKTSSYVIIPMMVGVAVCADSIIRLLFTERWIMCVPYLQIFAITYALYPIHTANLNALKAIGRSDLFLKLEIIKKAFGLALLLISVKYGPLAMAFTCLISGIVSQIINTWPNRKLLKYGYIEQIKDIFPEVMLSFGMGIIVYYVSFLNISVILKLMVQVIVGIAIYIIGSRLFRLDSFEYILYLVKKKKGEKMLINVTRSSMPDFEEYCNEIKDLWDTHWLTNMGEKHKELESLLEQYLDCPYVTLYTNGHLALENIIAAMNFQKGGEVITTPFTFASTTHAIVRNGLIPVFCDITPIDYTIDVAKMEELITDRTVAIVPVHVYGNMCDVEAIQKIADKHKLKVIYDAAHAFAVKYKGVSSANFGDASMFSFHATKVFNTIEGGAVCLKDEKMVGLLNDMKNFGIRGPEECVFVGGNAKMNELQAAMGICNLRHLDTEIAKRKKVVEHYTTRLSEIEGIKLCKPQKDIESNYAYFPVVFDHYKYDRNTVCDLLKEKGIFARKYFYPLTNSFACYENLETAGGDKTPIAAYFADRIVTLPLYADLSLEDVDLICDIILK